MRVTVVILVCALALAALAGWLVRRTEPQETSTGARSVELTTEEGTALLRGRDVLEAPSADRVATSSSGVTARDGTLRIRVDWPDERIDGRTARVWLALQDGTTLEATTDGVGIARFADVPPGDFVLAAFADPHYYGSYPEPPSDGEGAISLDVGIRVRGHVRAAEDDAPVAGAEVFVDRRFRVRTDARGRYVLPFGPRGPKDDLSEYSVVALFPGRALGTAPLPDGSSEENEVVLDVRLEAGGTIRGSVLRPDGTAASRAEVVAVPEQPDRGSLVGDSRYRAVTDEAGRYEIHGLPFGGLFSATAELEGFIRADFVTGLAPTEFAPTAEAVLALRRPATLLVRVDPDVPEAMVQLTFPDDDRGYGISDELLTRRTVPVRYGGLAPGRYDVGVSFPPGAPWIPTSETIHVPEGAQVEHRVSLVRAASIRGAVLDERGLPAPGVVVVARDASDGIHAVVTDERGEFHVGALAPHEHQLSARLARHVWPDDEVAVRAPATDVRLSYVRPGLLRLHTVVPSGSAVPQRVEIIHGNGPTLHRRRVSRLDDVFSIPMPAGRNECRFYTEGFAPWEEVVEIRPAQETSLTARLEPGRTVTLRVVDRRGLPLPKAWVLVERGFAYYRSVKADVEGRLTLNQLPAGPARLRVGADGLAPAVVNLAEGETTIVLARGGTLRGRLLDERGRGMAGESIDASDPIYRQDDTRWRRQKTDEVGRFRMLLPAGHYVIAVSRDDATVPIGEADVEDERETEVEVRGPPR